MFRKIVSLSLLVSLVALSSSGILMILLNDFAFQLQMHPIHKVFGVILTVSGAIHVYYNFSAIKKYLGTQKLAIFTAVLTVVMVLLVVIGMYKPLDMDKVKQIEEIMQTLEG